MSLTASWLRGLVIAHSLLAVIVFATSLRAMEPVPPDQTHLAAYCYDCHTGTNSKAGLDLKALGHDLNDPQVEQRWVRVIDRMEAGEMPPPDAEKPEASKAAAFVSSAGQWLREFQRNRDEKLGRVRARRLTRREVERSLQDLLGIDIPLADQLPEEASSNEFSTIANGQAMSHFQLERHLAVVDAALDEAFRRALTPGELYSSELDHKQVARRTNRRTREPEVLDGRAVTWSSGLIFYGRLPATIAPESGWYRFRIRAAGLKQPEWGGVWCTVRSGPCVSSAPLLSWIGALEAFAEPSEWEFEAWLPKNHMLEIRPGDSTLKKARFAGGQVGNGEGEPQNVPGIAIEQISMQQFHRGPDDDGLRKLLFGHLKLSENAPARFSIISGNAKEDAARLLQDFSRRAFRRPVAREEIGGYIEMTQDALEEGHDLAAALRVGMRAVLCSPRFLYLTEAPGRLDDYAIATRLSYLLTGSIPDRQLEEAAAAGLLHDPASIRQQVERLLVSHGRVFLQDFAAEWIDLDQIDFTEPDTKLFPTFDSIVQQSMLRETSSFLQTMLDENLGVSNLIQSNFTFLNSRLARFYDINGVHGDELQRVALEPQQRRGGLLTQGSILKVTANGSNTSPVVRGVWVSERLLGESIPPPPANVPAIEPDIRGAKTIREILAKHRAEDSCAVCHVKIDPPGFALENYDPAGRWRDRYVQLIGGKREQGGIIDASYVLPDGREFRDIQEFRELIVSHPRKLARNLAEKLLVYGTGANVSFADRLVINQIVDHAAKDDYGFRSLIHAVTTSRVFLSK